MSAPPAETRPEITKKSDPWTDLGLTLPIFAFYHLGVVLLPVRNAADMVTGELRDLAKHSLPLYACLTLGIGAVFVAVLGMMGRKTAFEPKRFLFVGLEGGLYAVIMRFVGSYVVGSLRLAPSADETGPFGSIVMAMGAGFYEEVVFRVGIYGVGAAVLRKLFPKMAIPLMALWGVAEACAFSAWHYSGGMSDAFDVKSFVFRATCGLFLTLIYQLRGFAPAVWTHTIYDIWVMVFDG